MPYVTNVLGNKLCNFVPPAPVLSRLPIGIGSSGRCAFGTCSREGGYCVAFCLLGRNDGGILHLVDVVCLVEGKQVVCDELALCVLGRVFFDDVEQGYLFLVGELLPFYDCQFLEGGIKASDTLAYRLFLLFPYAAEAFKCPFSCSFFNGTESRKLCLIQALGRVGLAEGLNVVFTEIGIVCGGRLYFRRGCTVCFKLPESLFSLYSPLMHGEKA